MTFQVELSNHGILKQAFESISLIVDEIALLCDSEGIHMSCLDKSHITFVTMELNKTLFDTYQCDEPEKIFVDAGEFTKMLKKAKPNEILELSIDEGTLIITLKGDATRKFKIRLIDLDYEQQVPPEMNTPCSIRMPSGLLKTYIDDMADFDEKLTFIIDENYFRITADGQMGSGEISYIHGEHINETAESHFSIPKLKDILKASKFSEQCTVSIGNDMPLMLRMDLVTGDGYLEYLLAPRLNEEV